MTDPRSRPRLPWRSIATWALVGAVAGTVLTFSSMSRTRDTQGWFLHVGPGHPTVELFRRDFPDEPIFTEGEHDGAQFYAIAKDPWHVESSVPYLDRPRYRLQRPMFPIVAWLLRPDSSGYPLAWTMIGIGIVSMLAGGMALGALSSTLGGKATVGVFFGIMPGSLIALRLTVPDTMATALVLWAVVLSLRGRTWAAVLAAVAAVLTKEPTVLVLAGVALWRRDREGWILAGVPVAVAGAWALYLRRVTVEGVGTFVDIQPPFVGLVDSVRLWLTGESPLAMISVVGAVGLAAVALRRRGLRHPLSWAVVANLAFLLILNIDTIGLERGGTRTVMPLLCLAAVMLSAPGRGVAIRPIRDG